MKIPLKQLRERVAKLVPAKHSVSMWDVIRDVVPVPTDLDQSDPRHREMVEAIESVANLDQVPDYIEQRIQACLDDPDYVPPCGLLLGPDFIVGGTAVSKKRKRAKCRLTTNHRHCRRKEDLGKTLVPWPGPVFKRATVNQAAVTNAQAEREPTAADDGDSLLEQFSRGLQPRPIPYPTDSNEGE